MAALSAATWGDPAATKHVLLLHGIISLGEFWHRVARDFASRGYFVVAPDLIGHGRGSRGSDYTFAAYVEALRSLLAPAGGNDHRYHIVVGHSLGGVVAAVMLPLLKSTRSIRVVLVDPPLEQTPEELAFYRGVFTDIVSHPKTPEEYQQEEPHLPKEGAVWKSLAVRLCDVATVQGTVDQNVPWSFTHLLSEAPENVKVTVLAADPSKHHFVREEDMKPYPHVTVKTVWGASHGIPVERPEVVIETALQDVEPQE